MDKVPAAAAAHLGRLQRQIRSNSDELNRFVKGVHEWQDECNAGAKLRPSSNTSSQAQPVLTEVPNYDDLRENGNSLFRAGKYAEAAKVYSQCVDSNAGDLKALCNRAATYLKLGCNADAEADCNAVVAADPNNAKALMRRGTARAALKKTHSAIIDFERIVQLSGPDSPSTKTAQQHINTLRAFLEKMSARSIPTRDLPASVRDLPRRRLIIEEISDNSCDEREEISNDQ